jgi:peptidoglycan/LPS O-acetylase OafA/YrhL
MTAAAQVIDQAPALPLGRREGYMPYLDGLRGIAIFQVLLLHAGVPFIKGGWVGVDLFFVLSGFLITSLLMREQEKTGRISLKHFYMRRVLRLMPAVIVMLAVFLVVAAFRPDFDRSLRSALYVLFYIANWMRAFGHGMSIEIAHCWSLSIEEQFYFIWPLLVILLFKARVPFRTMAWLALAGVVACAAWRTWLTFHAPPGRVYFGLDTRSDALLLGCALALGEAFLIRPRRVMVVLVPAAVLLITWVTFRERMVAPWLLRGGYTLVALAACVLIVDLKTSPAAPLRKLCEWGPLVYLGRISYGLYLWHHVVMEWMKPSLEGHFFRWPILLFVGGGLSLAIAMVSYRFLEIPFLKLKSRFQ